jgi:hypothetical protein
MTKSVVLLLGCLLLYVSSQAQYRGRRNIRHRPSASRQFARLPEFKPSVNLSFGYGLPNLDKNELLDFYDFSRGTIRQTGPLFGAIDYQFRRTSSIGVIVSYGKVSAPYYDIFSPSPEPPAFTGQLKNWTVMLNFVRYMPLKAKINPYIRTAIGVNVWDQAYLDDHGNKVVVADDPAALAYQAALGIKFKLSKQSGIFLEAGYGKYIVSGGLSLKF